MIRKGSAMAIRYSKLWKKLIDEKFGQMLHAEKIGFVHPTTKEYMEFTAPVPDRFKEILDGFR